MIVGSIKPALYSRSKYFVTLLNDYSAFSLVTFVKKEDGGRCCYFYDQRTGNEF